MKKVVIKAKPTNRSYFELSIVKKGVFAETASDTLRALNEGYKEKTKCDTIPLFKIRYFLQRAIDVYNITIDQYTDGFVSVSYHGTVTFKKISS